jgi:hypothetical protein
MQSKNKQYHIIRRTNCYEQRIRSKENKKSIKRQRQLNIEASTKKIQRKSRKVSIRKVIKLKEMTRKQLIEAKKKTNGTEAKE